MKSYGYTAEIVTKAFQKSGYEPEYEFMPWSQALKLTEAGRYQACMPAYHSKEREQIRGNKGKIWPAKVSAEFEIW